MPLEGVYFLMTQNRQEITPEEGRNILNGNAEENKHGVGKLQLVTGRYFQSTSLAIKNVKVNDAVLAFCSLVMSYAKNAASKETNKEKSPKSSTAFMPRTEFVTLYSIVKDFFPQGQLYEIFNTLACYKTDKKLGVRYVTNHIDEPSGR